MGSWSTHPLGNDFALDYVDNFYELSKIPRAFRNGKKPLLPKHVAALVAALPLIDEEEHFILPYVLPWMIHETGTRIADQKISATIKALIAATPDEYGANPGEPSTKRFIANLEKYWDGIMNGTIPFEAVENDQGLYAAMLSGKTKPGMKGIINRTRKKPR